MNDIMYQHLVNSKNILIAGCGGGYDVYAGIPLYEELVKTKNVYLANYTFTDVMKIYNHVEKINEYCLIIDENTPEIPNDEYFPELTLAKQLKIPIYVFREVPPQMLYDAYTSLIHKLNIDTIILVDGGTDSLLFGDEKEVGSPLEDLTSVVTIVKISQMFSEIKCYLYCTALYIDDIDMNMFYRNISTLMKNDGFVGFYSMNKSSLLKNILENTSPKSIINESIVASMNGEFGRYKNPKLSERIIDDDFPTINPLVASYWIVHIDKLLRCSPIIKFLYNEYNEKIITNKINNDHVIFNRLINSWLESHKTR
jgi:hypothetical protein